MRFHTITFVSNYIDNPRIDSFHAEMFHGLAERDGEEYPHCPNVFAYSDSFGTLTISRSGRRVPEITQPSGDFVVSESLAEKLKDVPNIRISPVAFKRLVDVEYEKGDLALGEKWGYRDPHDLLRLLPDVPEFHETIGSYFEIHTWRLQDVVDRYEDATDFALVEGMPPMDEIKSIRLSKEMLSDYPILWFGDTIVSEEVLHILRNDLDPDLFIVRDYVIP